MELGDRVYAAERITKKREKRVSIASSRIQVALPGGIRPRCYRPSVSPSSHLAPLISLFSFFLSLTAGFARLPLLLRRSRLRDIGHYAPTGTDPSLLPGIQCRSRRALVGSREHDIDRRRSTSLAIGVDYRFASVNETVISRPVTLRHRRHGKNNGVSLSKRSPLLRT